MPPERHEELWDRALADAQQEIGNGGTARVVRVARAIAWVGVVVGSVGAVAVYSLRYDWRVSFACFAVAVLGVVGLSLGSGPAQQVQLRARERLQALTDAYYQSELRSPDFYHSEAWKWIRTRLLKRMHPKCAHCGRRGSAILTVDHIIPRTIRPDLALETSNLEVICYTCKSRREERQWDSNDAALG